MEQKIVRFGVSMPQNILEAIDGHIGQEDRSAYLRRLAIADLSAAGKLPGSPMNKVRDEAAAAAEIAGTDVVIEALKACRARACSQIVTA